MSRSGRAAAGCSLALPLLLLAFDSSGHRGSASTHSIQRTARLDAPNVVNARAAFGLAQGGFEANDGQTDAQVKFLARGNGYSLFLTDTEAVFRLTDPVEQPTRTASAQRAAGGARPAKAQSNSVLRMKVLGAQSPARITGVDRQRGTRNYFTGSDRSHWRTDIPAYGSVRYANIYPGIDLLYHDSQGELEYDFVVAPGVEPRAVRLGFEGADTMQIDAAGDLVLEAAGRTIRQKKPMIYQEVDGRRLEIAGEYRLEDLREFGFEVAAYDHSRPLIIDPVLVYSSYLGPIVSHDGLAIPYTDIAGIAVDQASNAYVTGSSRSGDFPTLNPVPPTIFGRASVFVAKLTKDGALEYLTFIGGTTWDDQLCPSCFAASNVTDIAVDATGSASIVGTTSALDFPLTPGAFLVPDGRYDGFLTKFSPTGNALAASTIVDCACFQAIALDSEGNAWMTGWTRRQDIPTIDPLQPAPGGGYDAVIMKVNPTGTALMYSTYFGGSDDDLAVSIAIDTADEVYLVGQTRSADFPTRNAAQARFGGGWRDCWVTRMNHAGSALAYSTYLGGAGTDFCQSVALDGEGDAVVIGLTDSADFPTLNALQPHLNGLTNGIVAKLTATGALVYSTFLGGSMDDEGFAVAADQSGNAYVTGIATSPDFPVVGSMQPFAGPIGTSGGDAFVTKINPPGTAIIYSTFLGSGYQDYGRSIAVDGDGAVYVTGNTGCCDFPTRNPVQTSPSILGIYGFVAKIQQQDCSTDVTSAVDVVRFPVWRLPFTPLRSQWVLIHNKTTVPVAGPLAFVMDDLRKAVFIGSRLTTKCFSPEGDPFMVVPVGSDNVLGPNESVLTRLWFWKTQFGPLTYTHHVLSGIPTQ
jgi:hypothetical protein